MRDKIKAILEQSIAVKQKLFQDEFVGAIAKLAELTVACLKSGGKIILFGNGGSAADAQHIAAELVGRFARERRALAAIALSCNTSNLTAVGNDYGFQQVFSRQIAALGGSQDLAIGISTSGTSDNILVAISQAKSMGMKTAALTSERGKALARTVDAAVCIPGQDTARIQEAHITVGHILCALTEQAFCD